MKPARSKAKAARRSAPKRKTVKRATKRKAPSRRSAPKAETLLRQGFGSEPGFPISLAMRAGDFVFASAQGDHEFDPKDVIYDEKGLVISDGSNLPSRSVGAETRASLLSIEKALKQAGCTLENVVDTSIWLRDPRDFPEVNVAYAEFFKRSCPTRSVFRVDFMFDCRVEIKVTAYKPRSSQGPRRS
jgi:enamine deaminase RidA (YjgF/YER057c/UK114 family)